MVRTDLRNCVQWMSRVSAPDCGAPQRHQAKGRAATIDGQVGVLPRRVPLSAWLAIMCTRYEAAGVYGAVVLLRAWRARDELSCTTGQASISRRETRSDPTYLYRFAGDRPTEVTNLWG